MGKSNQKNIMSPPIISSDKEILLSLERQSVPTTISETHSYRIMLPYVHNNNIFFKISLEKEKVARKSQKSGAKKKIYKNIFFLQHLRFDCANLKLIYFHDVLQ